MFLWELKNGIISQNLRELCVIKINTNIPHIVASTSSATNSFITRCLSLSKAVLIPPCDFVNFVRRLSVCAQSPYYLLLLSVPEPVEGTFSLLISVPEPVEGTFSLLLSVPEPVEGTIISIALKSVHSIEHLWCSFENSKTLSFHKIFVNFVILKQIQKIHTQWLRQAQPPFFYCTLPELIESPLFLDLPQNIEPKTITNKSPR